MSDDTTKKIVITGAAAESMSPSTHTGGSLLKRRSNAGSRKKKAFSPETEITKVGAGMSPGTSDQLASTRVPGVLPPVERHNVLIPALGAAQPIRIGGDHEKAAVDAPIRKVILAKSSKTKKVILAAASAIKKDSKHPQKKRKTMKHIHISIGGPSFRKAKTLKKKTSMKTLDEVKAALEKAGLIKADTKAPEDVLRQMYTDFMVLKKRAL